MGRRTDFSLMDKYLQQEGEVYLSGIQALVRLPMDQHRADQRAGLKTATFISGYRGSPLGGLDLTLEHLPDLLREHHIHFSSGVNEDLAATAVFGSQLVGLLPGAKYDGVLGVWYGKAPGVDRSGDAFKHANFAGIGKNGGVLAMAGDDPPCKSSTLPNYSEVAFFDANFPILYPGNVQELLDLGLHGFALSRYCGLWVAFKVVTNVADESSTVKVGAGRVRPVLPSFEVDGLPFSHQINPTLLAPHSLEMERSIYYHRLEAARRYAAANTLNQIVVSTPTAWLGIITAGKTYYDVRQAFGELGLDDEALRRVGIRVLKLGMIYPLEPGIVQEFARGLQEILVVEEKRSFVELFSRDLLYQGSDRPIVIGKFDQDGQPLLPMHGEIDSDRVAQVIADRLLRRQRIESVAAGAARLAALKARDIELSLARPAYFCSGCPHNRSTVVPEGSLAAAGIGCHAMALGMERQTFGITQMGGEGAQWLGMAPFTDIPHIFQNIGDGTFFHSGSMAISAAVASGVNITYKILYNAAVAMTGGQDAAGALAIPELTRKLEAEGVRKIIVVAEEPAKYRQAQLAKTAEVRNREELEAVQHELRQVPGTTVLIYDQQCAAEKRRHRKRGKLAEPSRHVVINEAVCEGCGDCGAQSNCLSVQPVDTEFGRKTQIHQSSCNKDYSCLKGDCPSFITIDVVGGSKKPPAPMLPDISTLLQEPAHKVSCDDGYAIYMAGIGGTGVVTVNTLLGTAAMLEGKQVRAFDQTGLSQKGGPVVSSLKLSHAPRLTSNKVGTGEADLYLGFDILVATQPLHLEKAGRDRTRAVISTSKIPTGDMVRKKELHFPAVAGLLHTVEGCTRPDANVYLDAEALAERLLGDHMAANLLVVGAAYQAGAIPLEAASIEETIRLNGVAVEMNLQAFRWGRLYVQDRAMVERQLHQLQMTDEATPTSLSELQSHLPEVAAAARQLLESCGFIGETRRLAEIRIPELLMYQDAAYARQYAAFIQRVAAAETRQVPGQTRLSEAVARYLFKLMAYKDEYEVARLLLKEEFFQRLRTQFGDDAQFAFNLHPPLLRALGLKRKLRLGRWFTPALKTLRAMRVVRGTPFDLFGYAKVRRVERQLIGEYQHLIASLLADLKAENYDVAGQIAELPDLIRGYEHIKLASVAEFRRKAQELCRQLRMAKTPATAV
ncbi:MAG TPA: indolepyruvate ferredoxin oxidoreductase family protein [Candidatus Tectomicrobia bacterium]|nr:indolepyruvate ferredoxin oxidoreductase family protein [Candidatus Tectomicrobia bacterium]